MVGLLNVLHIISDDLRPELPAYGQAHVSAPHMESLAAKGVVFDRAYAQVAVCVPSRASFMSGRRPQRTGVTGMQDRRDFRQAQGAGDWLSLPQWFRSQGWATAGVGKSFHGGALDAEWTRSFSQPCAFPGDPTALCGSNDVYPKCPDHESLGSWCALGGDEEQFVDVRIAAQARRAMRALAAERGSPPWYLVVGFMLPHGSWAVPTRVWRQQASVPAAALLPPERLTEYPVGVPWAAWHGATLHEPFDRVDSENGGEALPGGHVGVVDWPERKCAWPTNGSAYDGEPGCACAHDRACSGSRWTAPIPTIRYPDRVVTAARRAYFAAVSFVDEQVGKVLRELEQLGSRARKRTLIALHSDHGYALGEGNNWRKSHNGELATRVPLIVYDPRRAASDLLSGAGASSGARSSQIFELLDLYPTLSALAGAGVPPDLDGTDLSAAVSAAIAGTSGPTEAAATMGAVAGTKDAAYSQFQRCGFVQDTCDGSWPCADDCATDATPWEVKCEWTLRCSGCPRCNADAPRTPRLNTRTAASYAAAAAVRDAAAPATTLETCKSFCTVHAEDDWPTKCHWQHCSGCASCDRRRLRATSCRFPVLSPHRALSSECAVHGKSAPPHEWEGLMGFAVRTARWRLVAWVRWHQGATTDDCYAIWAEPPLAVELYDHGGNCTLEQGACERVNLDADDRRSSGDTAAVRSELLGRVPRPTRDGGMDGGGGF